MGCEGCIQEQQPNKDGAWKGWNEWPPPNGRDGGVPYLDIDFI